MELCEWQGDKTKLSQLFKDDIPKVIVYNVCPLKRWVADMSW